MLGDITPQSIKIDQRAVVYPGRDHVNTLTVKRFDGRKYKPVDLTALTRAVLVFPNTNPIIAFDTDETADVISWLGSTITVDLSKYQMPDSIQCCFLTVFDAEHPNGQVLVDDNDSTLAFDFRNVSSAGTLPPPLANTVQRTAGENLSALRVVYELGGEVFYIDYLDTAHIELIRGVTVTSASAGGQVSVRMYGDIEDDSWSWDIGVIWLGANGVLTQTPPTTGFDVRVGSAVSPTRVILSISEPIEL